MIVFDGRSGGLGRCLAEAIDRAGTVAHALGARLEDDAETAAELAAIGSGREPACLVQLAARASVAACERDPEGARRVNVDAVAARVERFLRWCEQTGRAAAVVFVGTGHVYAPKPGALCGEDDRVAPRSVYATTKAEAEERLGSLCASFGAPLVIARVFGMIAPVQPATYLLPSLIHRVRGGDVGAIPGLRCVRDYLDARDVSRALLGLASRSSEAPRVVNVCSGEGTSVREMLEMVIRRMRGDDASALLAAVGEAPGRADDVPWLVGDPQRLRAIIGPPRTIDLRTSIDDAVRASA
jgi:nucleoside-diphosphate-sugar epimerase